MTMKDHLEDKFKDVINNYEVPYDPAAWNKLSGTLDKRFPVNGGSSWKWFLGGGIILVVLSTTLLVVYNLKYSSQIVSLTSKNTKSKNAKNGTRNLNLSKKNLTKDTSSYDDSNFSLINKDVNASIVGHQESIDNAGENRLGKAKASDMWEELINNSHPVNIASEEDSETTIYPTIQDLCQGDKVSIENSNDTDIFLTDLYKVYPIPAGKKFNFTAENPGNYYFGKSVNGKIEYSKTVDFKVKSAVQASIEFDDDSKYENGVPTTELSAKANESCSFSWNIETLNGELTGREIKTHLYNKGTYNVVLKATPKDGGCEATVTREISIDETYNLLAVNSFWPNSPNPKNATFMPYALTERNTDFSMLIIDPTNGVTLFETSDATNGWNGTNRTTGQLVDANKAFIWIVKLKNPLPGEKSEYKGTIVRMP